MKKITQNLGVFSLSILGTSFLFSFSGAKQVKLTNYETVLQDGKGKELFIEKCTKCHSTEFPKSKADRKKMKAPPIMGVMFHVNDGIKAENEVEKKQKVIDFIVDYAHNPSKDKSFCEAHAIERFGVMPSQKGNVTKEELKLIATYLYNAYPSKDEIPFKH